MLMWPNVKKSIFGGDEEYGQVISMMYSLVEVIGTGIAVTTVLVTPDHLVGGWKD